MKLSQEDALSDHGWREFDPQIAADFRDLGIDVLQAYGLTETTGGRVREFANQQRNRIRGAKP